MIAGGVRMTVRVTISLPDELLARLDAEAADSALSRELREDR